MEEPAPAQKRRKSETTAESENDNVILKSEVKWNTLISDVLREIFDYLNARDLASAAMVCRYITCIHNML